MGFVGGHLLPRIQVRMSSSEECPCAEGYWPQFDRIPWKGEDVHFGCCPGRGISACGPQKAPIRTFAEVSSSICLICILLTTLVIHYRQPQLSKIKCGDSAIENSPLVHDGAKLHAPHPPKSELLSTLLSFFLALSSRLAGRKARICVSTC